MVDGEYVAIGVAPAIAAPVAPPPAPAITLVPARRLAPVHPGIEAIPEELRSMPAAKTGGPLGQRIIAARKQLAIVQKAVEFGDTFIGTEIAVVLTNITEPNVRRHLCALADAGVGVKKTGNTRFARGVSTGRVGTEYVAIGVTPAVAAPAAPPPAVPAPAPVVAPVPVVEAPAPVVEKPIIVAPPAPSLVEQPTIVEAPPAPIAPSVVVPVVSQETIDGMVERAFTAQLPGLVDRAVAGILLQLEQRLPDVAKSAVDKAIAAVLPGEIATVLNRGLTNLAAERTRLLTEKRERLAGLKAQLARETTELEELGTMATVTDAMRDSVRGEDPPG
jgi:hypothetical protein